MIEVRDRLSSGLDRSRVTLEAKRSVGPLAVLAIGALIALGCWFVLAKNVGPYIYKSTRTVSFRLADASGIVSGRQEVRFRGVPAGVISRVENRPGEPVATVKLYSNFGPIYRDAHATLRPNSALEDMYLDILDRGHRAAGLASTDHPVPASNVATSVQVEDVLQAFQPNVRAHLGVVLRDLGGGLKDRGASLRAAFQQLVPFLDAGARLSRQLSERTRLTRQLVHNISLLTAELGRRQVELRRLVDAGGATLQTLANGSHDLDATLHQLPPTLNAINTSFTAVRGVLPEVNGALVALRPTVNRLPAGLAAVRRFSRWAHPALVALRPPVKALNPLALALVPVSRELATALRALRPQIPAVNHATKTVAGCPTALQGFFQWTPSTIKLGDVHGPVIRGDAAFSLETSGELQDPNVRALPSCAPGAPIGGVPGTGGDLKP